MIMILPVRSPRLNVTHVVGADRPNMPRLGQILCSGNKPPLDRGSSAAEAIIAKSLRAPHTTSSLRLPPCAATHAARSPLKSP
jgi:hypothetical protein